MRPGQQARQKANDRRNGHQGRGARNQMTLRIIGEQCRGRPGGKSGNSEHGGKFADTLDELTSLLATRARAAVARGDERAAIGASRAIVAVEHAKTLIPNNVNPALITAALLRAIASELA